MESKNVTCYKCDNCGSIYKDKSIADNCCKPKLCEDCGCKLDRNHYYVVCDSCREKREYDRATKIKYDDYIKEHTDDDYTLAIGDNFYCDLDDLLDSNEDDEIGIVNGVYKDRVELDYDSIIVDMEENSDMEDFTVDKEGYNELKEFLVVWNKKYGTDRYGVDNKVIVLIKDGE